LERIKLFHDLFGRHLGDDGIFFPVRGKRSHDVWGVPGTRLDHVALEEELKKMVKKFPVVSAGLFGRGTLLDKFLHQGWIEVADILSRELSLVMGRSLLGGRSCEAFHEATPHEFPQDAELVVDGALGVFRADEGEVLPRAFSI
jgi:hypothetical protein